MDSATSTNPSPVGAVIPKATLEAIVKHRPREVVVHASDCAMHNAPALPPGPCTCGAATTER